MTLAIAPTSPYAECRAQAALPILLIDDDPDCRQLIRDAIEQADPSQPANPVYEASSGEEALAFLCHADPDTPRPGLIFMDLEMPGMGGHETLRAIRAQPQFADIPVVMLTAVTDDHQKRRALQLGANSFTHKPADAHAFIHTVIQTTRYWTQIHQHPARPNEKTADPS